MPRRWVKIISACFFLLFLAVSLVFSGGRASYLSPFVTKNNPVPSSSVNFDESGQAVNSDSSVSVAPSDVSGQEDASSISSPEGAESNRVVKVVDGDTVDVDIDGSTTRLRIIGIDTPETVDPRKPVQCFGREASNKAKEILTGQFVTLTADGSQGNTDKYGRLLRYIALPDGTDYGLYMISQGYAHEYTYHLPYEKQADYKQAEIDARSNNRGLWSPDTCSGNK